MNRWMPDRRSLKKDVQRQPRHTKGDGKSVVRPIKPEAAGRQNPQVAIFVNNHMRHSLTVSWSHAS
jgi:hypothetical protein